MKKIKITSCEAMPDNEPGTVVVKDREALKKEAERLKEKSLPVLDEKGNDTGKRVTNIRTEGPYLVGDADIPDDKYISIHYNPTQYEVNALLQDNLNIRDVYFTSTPRFIAQKADSLMSTPNQPPAAPAAAPSTPPAQTPQPAPPVVTPPAPVEDPTLKQLEKQAFKELLASKLASLNAKPEWKAKVANLSPKEQWEKIQDIEGAIIPPAPTPPAPAAQPPAPGVPPVPMPTTANSTQPAPAIDTGFPFTMLTSLDPDQHPVRGYNPAILFGPKEQREAKLKELRGY